MSAASEPAPAEYADAVVAATDAVRLAEGLPALPVHDCATAAAEVRATALVGSGELAHAPLDGVTRDCAAGSVAGENLSRAAAPAADVVAAWMGSPGHRANLLDPAWSHVGVACAEDEGAMLCSQVFLGP